MWRIERLIVIYGQNIHRALGVGILLVSVSIRLPLAYRD